MIHRLVVALAPLFLFGCGGSSPEATSPSGPPQWSYDAKEGPAHWGEIDPSFAACSSGKAQTPIDLPSRPARSKAKAPALPKWDPVPIRVINDGHSIKVEDPAPSTFTLDGTTYALKNFHFHVPGEHTIDGRSFDAEMHFVHKSAEGKTLVIALLVQRGRENDVLRPVLDAIPIASHNEPVDTGKTVDLQALLPKSPKYIRYEGSLTVPPCTEGVTWLVIVPDPDVPTQMSDGQLGRIRSATHGPTSRPIQPLNGRAILEIIP